MATAALPHIGGSSQGEPRPSGMDQGNKWPFVPPRPAAPPSHIQLSNVTDGETVHQRFLLVHGNVSEPWSTGPECTITVFCHNFSLTTWPCVASFFKALVHLQPGQNTVSFVVGQEPPLHLHVTYIPLLQNPPLSLYVMVAADSPCTFDVPPEKSRENTLEIAKEKLRMAGYLWQAFCGEQMRRHGFGRRTFRLDEGWMPDTVSRHLDHRMTQTAHVHVVRSSHSVREIHHAQSSQQSSKGDKSLPDLYTMFQDALHRDMSVDQPCFVAGLILDSHWDPRQKIILGHAALGAGPLRLGIFGSHSLHAWPRCIEDVVSCMMDTTRTDTRYVANDAGESGEWWKALNIGMGAMLHEVGHSFHLPHTPSGIMSRGFNHWNRTFMVKEPGHAPIPPSDEGGSHWHRTNIIRLLFHPPFRIEPTPPVQPEAPRILLIDADTLMAVAPAGMCLLEMMINGQYRYHLEFTGKHQPIPTTYSLDVTTLRLQCDGKPTDTLGLTVTSINQQSSTIDNVDQFLHNHLVRFSDIPWPVIKSQAVGDGGLGGQHKTTCLLYGRIVRHVMVYSGAAVDGLVIVFSDGRSDTLGKCNGSPTRFELYSNEVMVGFHVRSGAWIDAIQIKTSLGRASPWFGNTSGGSPRVVDTPPGLALVGLYATAGNWIDQFGIYYAKPPS